MIDEPTLFDEHDQHARSRADSLWRECSLTTFMQMSEVEQLDYCARRDEDSARYADDETDARFYRDRAAWYRRRVTEITASLNGTQNVNADHAKDRQ